VIPNTAPAVTPILANFSEDDPSRMVDLLDPTFVSDADGDNLSVDNVLVNVEDGRVLAFFIAPETAMFLLADGQFEILSEGDALDIVIRYDVFDGLTSTANTATISINGANDAPTLIDDSRVGFTAGEKTPLTTPSVLANDSDPDGDTLIIVDFDASGTQGVVSHLGDGVFSYDPNGAFDALNLGEAASDSFTYRVSDGVETRSATVTITIEGVDDPTGPNVIEMTPLESKVVGTAETDVILIDRSRSTQVLGGEGGDIFVFGLTADDGFRDIAYVRDFEQGSDLIDLSGADYSLRTLGGSSIITLDTPDRDTLFVTGVTLNPTDFTDAWSSGSLLS
jgi:VCBS repeat-containing protein